MKFLFSILLIFGGILLDCNAQSIAVMEARVNIISGATVSAFSMDSANEEARFFNKEIRIGRFSVTASKHSEIYTHVEDESFYSEFDSFTVKNKTSPQGIHELSISGQAKSEFNIPQQNRLKMVVEYF